MSVEEEKEKDKESEEIEALSHVAAASLIRELFAFAGTYVAYLVWYYMMHPTEWQLAKMKFLLKGKRACQTQADWWQTRATAFATAFNKEKN